MVAAGRSVRILKQLRTLSSNFESLSLSAVFHHFDSISIKTSYYLLFICRFSWATLHGFYKTPEEHGKSWKFVEIMAFCNISFFPSLSFDTRDSTRLKDTVKP